MPAAHANGNGDAYDELPMEERQPEDDKQSPWKQRKKLLRGFLLTNSYVPLVSAPLPRHVESKIYSSSRLQLFRFVNITFTTSALAIAIRIRALEMSHHVSGAVGSSP